MQIQKDAAALLGNHLHCTIHLFVAMAGRRSKHVPGQAVRLNPHQDILTIFDISSDEGDMRLLIENAFENDHSEVVMRRGQRRLADFTDKSFRPQPVADEIGDRDDFQPVQPSKLEQIRDPRHRSVFLHDLADDPGSG